MSAEARKDLVRRYYAAVWNDGNMAAADDLFAETYVAPMANGPAGPEGAKQHVGMIRTAFPDLRITVDELIAEGERVTARWTLRATNTGDFMRWHPTGKAVSIWGVDFFRFAGDKIVESWVGIDMLGLLIQLGVAPSPWQAG